MSQEITTFTFDLDEQTAWALAQFLKRVSHETCKRHSDPGVIGEPDQMIRGLCTVQRAMAEKGFAPR